MEGENPDDVKKCFVCLQCDEPVTSFKEDTLKKCQYSLAVRIHNGMKDNDKSLPDSITTGSLGYHSACYRSFNAIGKKYKNSYDEAEASAQSGGAVGNHREEEPIPGCSSEYVSEREFERESSPALSDNEIFCEDGAEPEMEPQEAPQPCIFCNRTIKKYKGRKVLVSVTTNYISMSTDKENATRMNDIEFLANLHCKTSNNESIAYHRICKTLYRKKAEKLLNKKNTEWHQKRNMHAAAFAKLCSFIRENIVREKKCFFISFLRELFAELLIEEHKGSGIYDGDVFDTQHIQKKIFAQKSLKNKIRSIMCGKKMVVAPHNVTAITNIEELQNTSVLQTAAMKLRAEVLKTEYRKLPLNVTTEDLTRGECTIPESVERFLQTVLCGHSYRRKKSSQTDLRVNSIASDLIYATTNGRILPSKHITLGITLKSLTSSKKVLSLINKLGHCISYNVVEELETEASYTSVSRSELCPSNILLRDDLHTGVAFDNFDRFVETIHGKDTLHDTVGIIYQDMCADDEGNTVFVEVASRSSKRRRTFDAIIPEIEPFAKRLKSVGELLPVDFRGRSDIPAELEEYKVIDNTWVISHFLKISTPMWVGFNAKMINDSFTKQVVSYLPTINASPTDVAVVVETMKRAIQIADECKQRYMPVTYDLAIAKIALQVQSMQKEEFSRLFIHLGPFHIEMSFLKAVGSFISNCGLTPVMVDSGLLAAGSVGGFLSAKNFNRAKRLHVLLYLALNMEHFKFFVETKEIEIDSSVVAYLKSLQSHGLIDGAVDNGDLRELIEKYQEFKEETLMGQHGKTAQFYLTYTNLIEHFLMLSRSVRTGDFSLFKYILPKINNLLFPMNHVNYARWLLRYHDNLMNVEKTHPGLSKELADGHFGIKRTDKSFSKQPIDLVTEQTINADAGRTLTGISHFTNSIQARIRWTVNYAIRSGVCSFLFDKVGLSSKAGITNDWNANRIKKCRAQIEDFISALNLRMNPFDPSLQKDSLYNISSGESAPPDVADFLLSAEKIGDKMRTEFIENCAGDESKFSTAVVRRTKVLNFDTTVKKRKIRVGDKVQEVKVQKDLFGRLLAISMEKKVDIAKVLTFPLTPVPLSMCHIDGNIHKTNKAVLTKELERKADDSAEPNSIDIAVYDGFAVFHMMKQVPGTFGKIAIKYLSTVCSSPADTIDVVFDEYRQPSIKTAEHLLRNSFSNDFTITGSEQIRPSNFKNELRNDKFKTALVHFIIEHWTTDAAAAIIGRKVVRVNFDQCYKYVVERARVVRTVDDELSCPGHEEADTKMVYHLCHTESGGNAVINCSDTDVLVIMLANMCHLKCDMHIWMNFGTGNSRRFIDVTKIYEVLGEKVCRSLPGLHALTGCDYNPSFYRKGKKTCLQVLLNSEKYQDAFTRILEQREESFRVLEEFICRLYNHRHVGDVNEVRLSLFFKAYSMRHEGEKFDKKLKNFDASLLPPCKAELHQQLLRVLHISTIWANAHEKYPSVNSPDNCGWKLIDGQYEYHWFDGNAMPTTISDIVCGGDDEEDEDSEEDIRISSDEDDESTDEDTDEEDGHFTPDSEI